MIAHKGQLVRLTAKVRLERADARESTPTDRDTARVRCFVYGDQPLGERGVQLDWPIGGEVWWLESDLEAVT